MACATATTTPGAYAPSQTSQAGMVEADSPRDQKPQNPSGPICQCQQTIPSEDTLAAADGVVASAVDSPTQGAPSKRIGHPLHNLKPIPIR